ncbi:MAG: undecaprenyl-diphosphate phosphatase [Planctomycetes bacterium]|nr:undecaprenyl-diphosphate phosphatase [Planctomycetota bacterium]
MELWKAAILGLVEGLTEYLPVSSTGHLILTERLLGMQQGTSESAFAICIQAGAILAVLGLYRRRATDCVRGVFGKSPSGFALAVKLALAFCPAALIGFLADDWIEARLFGLWPVACAWLLGGIVILFWPLKPMRAGRGLEELGFGAAIVIGFAQCLALWPGTSRSLATILGGLGVGLSLAAAVEFSFLLGVLTLTAATAYKALKSGPTMLDELGIAAVLVGALTAWVAAVISVRWMVAWLEHRGMQVFGWWRIALGLVVLALLWSGSLSST